jgi:LysR family glycine cleavage system transcriptional activator/LysR family transcriptional regulator of beta-lactamase
MRALPPLNALRAFEAAARHGGFARAGAELHVSPSAISRLVKLLEERLKVPLFVRRANGLALTERGASYLSDLAPAFERIAQATERVRASSGLVIGAGPTLAMRWLIPRLTHFHARHPAIEVRISTAIERADPLAPDWTAAIRRGDGAWPGFCAPALAKGLKAPGDLVRCRILAAANAPDDWPAWLKAAKVSGADLRSALRFDYPAYALQAAVDGLGVAMARGAFVADDLAAGRLVRPFGLGVSHDKGWYLVHRPELAAQPALAAFKAWVAKEAAA